MVDRGSWAGVYRGWLPMFWAGTAAGWVTVQFVSTSNTSVTAVIGVLVAAVTAAAGLGHSADVSQAQHTADLAGQALGSLQKVPLGADAHVASAVQTLTAVQTPPVAPGKIPEIGQKLQKLHILPVVAMIIGYTLGTTACAVATNLFPVLRIATGNSIPKPKESNGAGNSLPGKDGPATSKPSPTASSGT